MPKLTAIIDSSDRVAITVSKQILIPKGTIGRNCYNIRCIRADESPELRVIVPAVQVIQPGLGIVIVPPVAEGVFVAHGVAGGVVDPLALLDAAIRLAGQPVHGVVAVVHREAVAVLRGGQIAVIVLVGISDQGPAPGGGLQGVAEGVVGEGIRGGGGGDPREVAPAAISVAHGGRGAAGGAVVRGHLLQPVVIGVVGVFRHASGGALHRAEGPLGGVVRVLGVVAPVVHALGDEAALAVVLRVLLDVLLAAWRQNANVILCAYCQPCPIF